MAKTILLTNGMRAVVDEADYAWLSRHRWTARKGHDTFYANTTIDRKTIDMHRLIMGLKPFNKTRCDHIDRNGLNNQRCNLRLATQSQNGSNSRKRGGSSQFKGVTWRTARGCWRAYIKVNYKQIWLGDYDDEVEAALAYDTSAREHFGEFADLNFPPGCDPPEHATGTKRSHARTMRTRFAKLTADDVREARRLYAVGQLNQCQLARDLGVSRETIYHAVHGDSWADIT